jgi:hypothetical protein
VDVVWKSCARRWWNTASTGSEVSGVRNSHIVAHSGLFTAVRESSSEGLFWASATLLNFPPQYCGDGHDTALERTCLKVPTRCRLYCAVGKIADAK